MTFSADQRSPWRSVAWQLPVAIVLSWLALRALGTVTSCFVLFAYLAATTAELARIDLAEHRLPNRLVLPGFAFAAVSLVWQWLATDTLPVTSLVSGVGCVAFLLSLNVLGGMGMGDVKLGGLIGLAAGSLGFSTATASLVIAFVAGGIAGLAALALPGLDALPRIPFGPFLLFGFWSAVAIG